MNNYILSSFSKKLIGLSYKSTFVLIAGFLVFFLAIVFSVIQGWVEQDNQILMIGAYVCGVLMFMCITIMAIYAIGYLYHLWKSGHRKEAVKGLITFIFLNILTGYIWFYWSEIKNQKIRFYLG